ncbi:unnamed protein product [Nippostrongylus brasiliensis]|uniref:Uncharacterized protein n=1 Tax=Nippostrongylus brasiliensis TaxID=27835 RepID=A0A0N4XT03_NIPBR|nr:unnamed protein product [Nippostrongylus brasiliensis]
MSQVRHVRVLTDLTDYEAAPGAKVYEVLAEVRTVCRQNFLSTHQTTDPQTQTEHRFGSGSVATAHERCRPLWSNDDNEDDGVNGLFASVMNSRTI